jgi:hypothetical protein
LAVSSLLLVGAAVGCGGGDSSGGSDGGAPAPQPSAAIGDVAVVALTAKEICNGMPAADVGAVLGLDIADATASDEATPQCSYVYKSASGARSNVTIASMRGDADLGSRSGDEAFDYVLRLNRPPAGTPDFEEANLDAGARAVRLTGASLHLGILFVAGHLLTVVVPTPDAQPPQVDALVSAVADHFA